ncbi:retrotransposon protein, putative, ty1-copia subclass [Tanacetum coccineum]|uniref:Retrotransposon protein, putative, ty1-copia subclass n=1 Tax=Tanacetum coccineum TaxID=301880 RepID=A0ABQ4ZRT6_9ASTR
MEQPEGFVNPKYPNRVCKLKRSIYGLKQASRQWNKRFDDKIKKFGFTQNRDEPCVYLKASGSNVTFLILYVDDILIMGNNIPMLQDVKSYLGKCFAMKDLGEAAYILGIKIYRDRSRRLIGLCQTKIQDQELKDLRALRRTKLSSQLTLSLGMPLLGGTPTRRLLHKKVSLCPWTGSMKKLMTVKYCPRGENQKAGKSNPNLKVKGTDIPSYTLRFQELALMYRCMFPEESNEVEKYVSGLPDMIRGNVMSYRPQTMEEVIEFCNDNYSQKLITISERQADQKRKIKV